MSSWMKRLLLCWVIGFAATLVVLSMAGFAPATYRVAIFPIAKLSGWAGVGTHDLVFIWLLLIISPMFYGSLIVGCYRSVRKLFWRSESVAQPGAGGR